MKILNLLLKTVDYFVSSAFTKFLIKVYLIYLLTMFFKKLLYD